MGSMGAIRAEKDYLVVGTTPGGEEIRRLANLAADTNAAIERVLQSSQAKDANLGIVFAKSADGKVRGGVYGKQESQAPGWLSKLTGRKTVTWTYAGALAYDYSHKDLGAELAVGVWLGGK
jgi:hypothetical protein